jgi:hypothetical protein
MQEVTRPTTLKEKARELISFNRWVLASIVFFLFWKLFLVGILWNGRAIPPEPDDTYTYIADIAAVAQCHSWPCTYPGFSLADHSGTSYLTYSFLFGTLARITSLPAETIFYFSFYVGTVLLSLLLVPFLRSFTQDKNLIAWSTVFLAFYHGTGETHGFFWVVPSFFATLFFMALTTFVIDNERSFIRPWMSPVLVLFFVFGHPMSVYLSSLFAFYCFFLWVFQKSIGPGVLKRATLIIALALLFSWGQTLYLSKVSQKNFYGLDQSLQQATATIKSALVSDVSPTEKPGYAVTAPETFSQNIFLQRVATLNAAYFRWIFPHWIGIAVLATCLLLIAHKNQHRLLSFYLSSLFLFVTSTLLSQFGFRSSIIVWPATFVVYAFGSWYLLQYACSLTRPWIRRASVSFALLGTFGFFLINAIFGIAINTGINLRHKISIDRGFAKYIEENTLPGTAINLSPILLRTQEGSSLFFRNNNVPMADYPDYIAVINEAKNAENPEKDSTIRKLSAAVATRLGIGIRQTRAAAPPAIPQGYSLEKEYGLVEVYRKNQ